MVKARDEQVAQHVRLSTIRDGPTRIPAGLVCFRAGHGTGRKFLSEEDSGLLVRLLHIGSLLVSRSIMSVSAQGAPTDSGTP